MRKLRLNQRRIAAICAAVLVALSTITILRQQGVFDAAKNEAADTSQTQTPDEAPSQPNEAATDTSAPATASDIYAYTAAAGDSYTAMARDAIRKYAEQRSITLTSDQAFQAEIALANTAGSPLLEIGQAITIAPTDIATALGMQTSEKTAENESVSTEQEAQNDYAYTATVGGSYTALAREAVQTYAATNKLTLSPAQRVAAETQLAAAANFPALEIGQRVQFDAQILKSVVESASRLSSEQQALWQPYATLAGL